MTTQADECVIITIQHKNAEGATLSTLTLDYPTMDNASANALQLDIVDAMTKVIRSYSIAKAKSLGQVFPGE